MLGRERGATREVTEKASNMHWETSELKFSYPEFRTPTFENATRPNGNTTHPLQNCHLWCRSDNLGCWSASPAAWSCSSYSCQTKPWQNRHRTKLRWTSTEKKEKNPASSTSALQRKTLLRSHLVNHSSWKETKRKSRVCKWSSKTPHQSVKTGCYDRAKCNSSHPCFYCCCVNTQNRQTYEKWVR